MAEMMYDIARMGRYHFSTRNYNGTLNRHEAVVRVVGETERCYLIVAPCAIGSNRPGDRMRVHKKSVRVEHNQTTSEGTAKADWTDAWWNN